jgi:hypothetical protein
MNFTGIADQEADLRSLTPYAVAYQLQLTALESVSVSLARPRFYPCPH